MAKFKKALALVLSLAMVLTLAPIASVNSQAAAKYKISAKTTAISAGKTYNVKVTGVKKGQYVKIARSTGVTVKYAGKTIKASKKVAGTGKALTFKVTVPDKVANYKSVIKALVYNKKTNKKVKTLKTSRTVKVTKLEVTKVETASESGKYLTAYFSKKVDSLAVADVTIREKDTGIMKGVESVTLASDGKSASISLVGAEYTNAGVANEFVKQNVDYVFSVTKNGATASTTFTIDGILANAVVYTADGDRKVLYVENNNNGVQVTVPDSLTVDYEEILGTTVTVWYDKNMTITKLTKAANEKVVYGAFVVTSDGSATGTYLTDVATGTKYYTQNTNGESIYATYLISRNTTAKNSGYYYFGNGTPVDKESFAYAKLVLNATGTIRTVVGIPAWNSSILVGEVSGDLLKNGSSEQTMKGYTIVKDGKTASISDIVAGDVVFCNTAAKYAEIYTKSTVGKVTTVNKDSFVFEGKTYKFDQRANGATDVLRYKGASKLVAADADYMETLVAGKEDVTIFTDRFGFAAFVAGKAGAEETTSVTMMLTEAATAVNASTGDFFRLKGITTAGDAKVYGVTAENLTAITNGATEYKLNGTTVKSFGMTATAIQTVSSTNAKTNVLTLAADLTQGQVVSLTINKEGLIRKVSKAAPFTVDTIDGVKATEGTGDDSDKVTFRYGVKVLADTVGAAATDKATGQIADTATIFVLDKAANTGSAAAFKSFTGILGPNSGATKNGVKHGDLAAYIANGSVSAVVIDKNSAQTYDTACYVEPSQAGTAYRAVVSAYAEDHNGLITTLKVLNGKGEVEFKSFGNIASAGLAVGDIVTVTPDKNDATKLNGIAKKTADVSGAYTQVSQSDGTFKIGGASYELSNEKTIAPTIAMIDASNPEEPVAKLATLAEFENTKNKVNATLVAGTTDVVDVLVLTATAVTTTTPVGTGLTISMPAAAGTPVAATTSSLKIVKDGVTLTVATTGLGTIEEVKWYVAANNTSGYVRKAGWDGDLSTAGTLTAGQCAYAIVTDSNGVSKESEKVEAAASVITTVNTLNATAITSGNTETTFITSVKDQFGVEWDNLDNNKDSLGALTFIADDNNTGTRAVPTITLKDSGSATAGYEVVITEGATTNALNEHDKYTATLGDVTLTVEATADKAGSEAGAYTLTITKN